MIDSYAMENKSLIQKTIIIRKYVNVVAQKTNDLSTYAV